MALLYWSFRGLTVSLITRVLIYIVRFFLINWFKLVKGNALLQQVVKNEVPMFIIWAQFFMF